MAAMHEMGIANSVLEAALAQAQRTPGARVRKIGIRVGELAGVDPEALSFCFDALVKGTELAPLDLEIEYCLRHSYCGRCRENRAVQGWETACPACGGPLAITGGNELDLAYLEVDDDESNSAGRENPEGE